jgi:hypothetical protein
MQYFHLEQPLDEIVLCDREDCEGIADYLEVDDDGSEHRLCGLHTRSEKYASDCRHAHRVPTHHTTVDL